MSDHVTKLPKVTRFEVIEEYVGRVFVRYHSPNPVEVELNYQDDGRTLKVFVKRRKKK